MRISDWSSDVCSSDLALEYAGGDKLYVPVENIDVLSRYGSDHEGASLDKLGGEAWQRRKAKMKERIREIAGELLKTAAERALRPGQVAERSEEHTSELQSLMRISYAVFCLKKKIKKQQQRQYDTM